MPAASGLCLNHASRRPVPACGASSYAPCPTPQLGRSSGEHSGRTLRIHPGGHSERWRLWPLPLLGLQGVAGLDTAGTAGQRRRAGRAALVSAELTLQPARVCRSLREKTLPLDPTAFTHQRVSGCHCVADCCFPASPFCGGQGAWGTRRVGQPQRGVRSSLRTQELVTQTVSVTAWPYP